MFGITSVLLVSLSLQAPEGTLLQAIAKDDPAARFAAAAEIAALPELDIDSWLRKQVNKGSAQRQRALLLACALRGSKECLNLVDQQTRLRGNSKPARAWSLLLAATFQSTAAANSVVLLERARSDFERDCVLIGLMANRQKVSDLRGLKLFASRSARVHAPALEVLAALRGQSPEWPDVEDPRMLAGKLICSVLPRQGGVSKSEIANSYSDLNGRWSIGAVRSSGRSFDDLKGVPLADQSGAIALCLLEVDVQVAQAVFDYLSTRLPPGPCQSWLWGIAGARRLDLKPPTDGNFTDYHAAGILASCLKDEQFGRSAAGKFMIHARKRLGEAAKLSRDWPAAVMLALSDQPADWKALRTLTEGASGEEAARLHGIWQFASGRLTKPDSIRQIRDWLGELGGGHAGYISSAGRQWATSYLLAGTDALPERVDNAADISAFERNPDHALGHQLYVDIAEFINSKHYHWNIAE